MRIRNIIASNFPYHVCQLQIFRTDFWYKIAIEPRCQLESIVMGYIQPRKRQDTKSSVSAVLQVPSNGAFYNFHNSTILILAVIFLLFVYICVFIYVFAYQFVDNECILSYGAGGQVFR